MRQTRLPVTRYRWLSPGKKGNQRQWLSPEALAGASVTAEPDQRPRAGRRRPALALATLVLAGLTIMVLASMAGFAPGWHPATVPSPTPSGESPTTVAPVTTADSPGSSPSGHKPAASPAAQPMLSQSAVITSGKLAHKRGQGHGNGNGNGKAQTGGTSG